MLRTWLDTSWRMRPWLVRHFLIAIPLCNLRLRKCAECRDKERHARALPWLPPRIVATEADWEWIMSEDD